MPKKFDWTYAPEGTRFPVQPGEVWEAGPHRLLCGDLQQPATIPALLALALLARPAGISMVYVDPPWGAGNASTFRTKAGVPGKVDFPDLINAVLRVCAASTGPVFMEMGRQQAGAVQKLIEGWGGEVKRQWGITYYGRNPCVLLAVHAPNATWPEGWQTLALEGKDDEHTPALCIQALTGQGDVVCDPCTGRGLTAVSADAAGRTFVGSELSPYRLSVTLSKLADRGHRIQSLGRIDHAAN